MTTLVWFRLDLRLTDNPALCAALEDGGPVVPVYIHSPAEEDPWRPGGATRWWLHHSLQRLDEQLRGRGSALCLRSDVSALAALLALAREVGATRVLWNRRYEPAAIARDRHIKTSLHSAGIATASYNGALLHEPWTVQTQSGGPFQVFTPFWRRCKALPDPPPPLPAPLQLPSLPSPPATDDLDSWNLLPRLDWADGMRRAWEPGSAAAQAALAQFLRAGLADYAQARDLPGRRGTSRLSPHLHFGELSPREVWHASRQWAAEAGGREGWRDSQFLAEVGWREFAHHLLYHFPQTPEQPLRTAYAGFPWRVDPQGLRAWQDGLTGYPIVDAGMRELWRTGWMHNRVRMIVASFLVKDLLLPWQAGARWFWDTLVDADLASNTLGWQWAAGCGADAAPYFRIFNPVSQGTRFDPQGTYVRQWVPELAALPDQWLHQPWAAPAASLAAAGVRLGSNYPHPRVEHASARRAALQALATLKAGGNPAGTPPGEVPAG